MNIKRKMTGVALTVVSLALPTLAPGALFGETQTRSDIEGLTIPSGWNASERTTYEVEVSDEAFDYLDSRLNFSAECAFDFSSLPWGLLMLIR